MDDRWRDAAATDLRVEADNASLDRTEFVDALLAADAGDATSPTGSGDRIDPGDLHHRGHRPVGDPR